MTNLKLVADAPTPLEKLLLDASRAEQPSAEHKDRLRVALGFALPLAGLPEGPSAASAAPLAQPAAPLHATRKSVALTKVAASVAGLALVGALIYSRQPAASGGPVTSVAPSPVVVAPTPVRAVAPTTEELAVEPPLPVKHPAATTLPRASRGAAAAPAASADLSEQIRLIEAARAGVAGRDAKTALGALDSYAAKFPRGAFGQEAAVLRIRALEHSGDLASATALAKSFVARFPHSPHVARLKAIAERGSSR